MLRARCNLLESGIAIAIHSLYHVGISAVRKSSTQTPLPAFAVLRNLSQNDYVSPRLANRIPVLFFFVEFSIFKSKKNRGI
jgi:hypothetical protein